MLANVLLFDPGALHDLTFNFLLYSLFYESFHAKRFLLVFCKQIKNFVNLNNLFMCG